MQQKVVLITGATSGIGYQTAQRLAEQGHLVYGAVRRVEQLTPLESLGVQKIKLDISDEASVQHAVEEIIQEAGRMTSYFGAWYHATKYALEGFSDALRMEVKPFGIKVVLIEPGAIKTDWGIIAADNLEKSAKDGAYASSASKAANGMRKLYHGNSVSNPAIISKTVVKVVNRKRLRTRYLIGFGAKPLVFLHAILPNRIFDFIMMHAV